MKYIKLFEQFLNEGFDKPLHKKLLKFIESTKTWMDIYDEDDAEQIMLQTRENGDVGYEEAGSEDVAEAERVQKLINKKFPDLRVEIEQVQVFLRLLIHSMRCLKKEKHLLKVLIGKMLKRN